MRALGRISRSSVEAVRATVAEPAASRAPAQAAASGAERGLDPDALVSGWLAIAYERVISEPTDDAWAYYMEQTIRQFLAGHAAAAEFAIEYVECRTTLCQIRAAGYEDQARLAWGQVLYDMSLQPWYEFGQRGTSLGRVDGRFMIVQDLHKE